METLLENFETFGERLGLRSPDIGSPEPLELQQAPKPDEEQQVAGNSRSTSPGLTQTEDESPGTDNDGAEQQDNEPPQEIEPPQEDQAVELAAPEGQVVDDEIPCMLHGGCIFKRTLRVPARPNHPAEINYISVYGFNWFDPSHLQLVYKSEVGENIPIGYLQRNRVRSHTIDVIPDAVARLRPNAWRSEITTRHRFFFTTLKFRFDAEVGPDGRRELFEWRRSKGEAIRGLNGERRGWKLVRLTRIDFPRDGRPLEHIGAERYPMHYTNTWEEEVAVWSRKVNLDNPAQPDIAMAFLGRAKTGWFRDKWAAMVLLTFTNLWYEECVRLF
ncbi:hypothetical protein B0T10DRAFT_73237 [Thelonectria olida]|uniref:Uncharacterized protein n=1 Tax=Thelonectria olida TaxID=1576542 RepID=A0A9P8W456_9HYPO|nr:hypothetical protein B0T10DRAFT_73237 [Thelonectria olida]